MTIVVLPVLLAAFLLGLLAAVEHGRDNDLVDVAEFTHRPMLRTVARMRSSFRCDRVGDTYPRARLARWR
ncbi:hypothetical protein [Microbispora siamensis]|uniref:hypothetical protein n=1 Tax=Microbispora siamensis TaxID=564413 RepID=UPI00195022BE|nr:hypothetical protein [Microbispora siamensis]